MIVMRSGEQVQKRRNWTVGMDSSQALFKPLLFNYNIKVRVKRFKYACVLSGLNTHLQLPLSSLLGQLLPSSAHCYVHVHASYNTSLWFFTTVLNRRRNSAPAARRSRPAVFFAGDSCQREAFVGQLV